VKSAPKVLWGEGLFLRPQHFQRQDLYHELRLAATASALHPYAWGVQEATVDRDALANGMLRFERLQVIFPDGEIYGAPETDPLPTPVNLTQREISGDGICFHLALPLLHEHAANFRATTAVSELAFRYEQSTDDLPDLFTNAVETPVSLLRKLPRLLSDSDPREQFVSLPLVRLRRNSLGGFELDSSFFPPALAIDAIPPLVAMLRHLLDMLQAKCAALYGYHREPSKHIIEFRSGDIASFWLLHTASSAFAELSHFLNHAKLHPEHLYQALLRLTGGLLTFSKSYSLDDLPAYDHVQPGPAFLKIDRMIRDLVETVISTRFVTIHLTEVKPSFHLGRLESEKLLLQGTAFYLSVAADMPPAELVETVPRRFKLGAPDDVEKIVLSALSGIHLLSAPQVPAAIPVRPSTYYFSIEPHGPLYERMLQAQSIMIYVPSGFKDLKLELFGVTP
jgi:type VI secretion system protein ImpJ